MSEIAPPMAYLGGTILSIADPQKTNEGKPVRNVTLEVPNGRRKTRVRVALFGAASETVSRMKKGDQVKVAGSPRIHQWEVTIGGKPFENSSMEVSVDGDHEGHFFQPAEAGEEVNQVNAYVTVYHVGELAEIGSDRPIKKRALLAGFLLPGSEGMKQSPSFEVTILGKDARDGYAKGDTLVLQATIDNQFWEPEGTKENRYKASLAIGSAGCSIEKHGMEAA